jgi:DNA mismatch repair protein MutL
VKHALAQFSITPTLDFELNARYKVWIPYKTVYRRQAQCYNGQLHFSNFTEANQAHKVGPGSTELKHWSEYQTTEGDVQSPKKDFARTKPDKGLQVCTPVFSP